MLASILLSACMVPERLHLTMIGAGTGSGAAIAQRLKTESFDSVAKSISPDSTDVAFYEIGWLTRGQLQAQKHAPIMLLLGAAGRADSVVWVSLNRAPIESLEAASASGDAFTQRIQRCEARFYGAVYMLAGGDSMQALPRLRLAVRECPFREYERAAAEQMLRVRE